MVVEGAWSSRSPFWLIPNELVASLASTKRSEIDKREGEEFEAEVNARVGLKAQQHALELILPGESPFHGEAS